MTFYFLPRAFLRHAGDAKGGFFCERLSYLRAIKAYDIFQRS